MRDCPEIDCRLDDLSNLMCRLEQNLGITQIDVFLYGLVRNKITVRKIYRSATNVSLYKTLIEVRDWNLTILERTS